MNKGLNKYHTPVLMREVVEGLDVKAGERYIDATVGGGGHTEAILSSGGTVLGIDRDDEAISHVSKKLSKWLENGSLKLASSNFDRLREVAKENNWEKVNGILFDLGVSSHQLDSAERGFSFQNSGKLDMRMDRRLSVTAADLVNALSEKELREVFFRFGGEKRARIMAKAIVNARKQKKIETTYELAEILGKVSFGKKGMNPATKVFMALRIVVNDELNSIESALPQAVDLLEGGGRLAVISFHDGEDRIVKNFMRNHESLEVLNKKPISPTRQEIEINPRARSAKLRLAVKKND